MKDNNLVYTACNQYFLKSTGLKNLEDIIGKSDFDLPWPKEMTLSYRNDDLDIIKTKKPKLNYLELQRTYQNEEVINLVCKWPMLDFNQNVIGVFCIYGRLPDAYPLIHNSKLKKQHFSIRTEKNLIQFTHRETNVLYHLIRGKSALDIAKELKLSNRTIESYIEKIKDKMQVSKKNEITEKIINILLDNDSISIV